MLVRYGSLRKIPYFHLISWCGSFVERHSFRIDSGESPETVRKLCLSTKCPQQEIRWNYGILRSGWKIQCLYSIDLCLNVSSCASVYPVCFSILNWYFKSRFNKLKRVLQNAETSTLNKSSIQADFVNQSTGKVAGAIGRTAAMQNLF